MRCELLRGCTVALGAASSAQPSLIHTEWVSPVTLDVWVWWMWHICPPEPLGLRLGGPSAWSNDHCSTPLPHHHTHSTALWWHTSAFRLFIFVVANDDVSVWLEDSSFPLLYLTHTHTCLLLSLCRGDSFQLSPMFMYILLSNHQHFSCVFYTDVVSWTQFALWWCSSDSSLVHGCSLVFKTCTEAQITTKQMCSLLHCVPVWEGRGLRKVLLGLLGNVAVTFSWKQSSRCPSYLFITEIINVYKRLLIALFTNDLWDL